MIFNKYKKNCIVELNSRRRMDAIAWPVLVMLFWLTVATGLSSSFLAQQAEPTGDAPAVRGPETSAPSGNRAFLTSREIRWLSQHDGQIRIGITVIPPQVLRVEGSYKGLSIDYIRLMERKLGCGFKLVPFSTWNEVIQAAKMRRIDMIFAAQQTPERLEYLLFTEPYIELPNMIVVRQDRVGGASLKEMKGWRVATSEGSAVHEYLKREFPDLDPYPVPDELSGLMKVSVGEADALVVEISRASYYIEKAGILNLRVAGDAGLLYRLRFAVRSDWPVLCGILDKGLAAITDEERRAITRQWVAVGEKNMFASKVFWILFAVGLVVISLVVTGVILWNRTLSRVVKRRTSQLQQELAERKLAQEGLRESEEKYRRIVDTANEGILVIGPDNLTTFVNARMTEMLGYGAAEIIGRPPTDFMFAEDVPDHYKKIEGRRKGVHDIYERRFRRKDGDTVWTRVSATPVFDEARRFQGSFGMFTDITGRKQAEDAMLRLNRQLRAISTCNQVLMQVSDEQTLLNRICSTVCEEAGYRMAWVGYLQNGTDRIVRPMAWAGFEQGYLAEAEITWADTERGRGPAGRAIREGVSACIQDFVTDPIAAPWRRSALQRGYRSSTALPLKDENSTPFGVLCIYSAQPDTFTVEEMKLLDELAGNLAFGICVLRTRAARKQADQDVALMSFALNKVGEAAFLIDGHSRFSYVNEEACKALGYTRDELLARRVADVDPDFPAERWADHWRELAAQRAMTFESRHKTKDGHVLPVEINANYIEYGQKSYNLALVRDITERKRMERELILREREYRTLLESVPDLIVRYDADLQRIYVNPAWEKASGLSAKEVVGVPPADIPRVPSPIVDAYLKKLREAMATGVSQTAEFSWFNANGEELFLEYVIVPEFDDQGRIAGVLAVGRDISDRRQMEQELSAYREHLEELVQERTAELEKSQEQVISLNQDLRSRATALEAANKELDAFAYTVSHDLRAPLRHIDGFIDLLQKRAGTVVDEQSRHYMDIISEAAKKMSWLIDDLLSFSRMGRHAYSMQQVEMEPLVRDIVRDLEPDTAGRKIEWHIGDLPSVIGDERMLRVALTNLIANALKFTRTRPQARIEIGSQNDRDSENVIFVRDNGVGFDMAYAEKLFGVFQRLHHADEFEGTGIGLASVRRIITRHGGRTWAQAELDRGAAFFFTLPRSLRERSGREAGE
jgi:PAS domain S-box-containing protein